MIKKVINRYLCVSILCLLMVQHLSAQEKVKVTGTVWDAVTRLPLEEVRVYSAHAKQTSVTDSTGKFVIEVDDPQAWLRIQAQGYTDHEMALYGRTNLNIYLQPENSFMYHSAYLSPEGSKLMSRKTGNPTVLNREDISEGYAVPDDAMAGRIAGLHVTNKSSMPGEGSVVTMRGLRTLVGENLPLIVVDGIPYFSNLETSNVIEGFSRSIFMPVNMRDVEHITFLKGADAAAYGSIGSNGVLLIETERSNATSTEIQIHTTEGIGIMKRRFPMMLTSDFKKYISDVAETRYSSLGDIVTRFPFLKDDVSDPDAYLYDNETNWQDEIYSNAFTSENSLKIMGGDAIAKYALSVGMLKNRGVIDKTEQTKYNTRLNADIQVSKRFLLFASAAFNYGEYDLQEQGLSGETTPVIAALQQAPLFSVYQQNRGRRDLPHFNNTAELFGLSNPVALTSDVEGQNRSYDVLVDLGGRYDLGKGLSASLIFGLYYNFIKESMFIPGNTSGAIVSLMDSVRTNTVRAGSGQGLNYYLKGNLAYAKKFGNTHDFSATLGYQVMTSRREVDAGSGMSIQSDFYKILGYTESTYGRQVTGFIDKWSWVNFYLSASYGFENQLFADVTASVDASSVYGDNHARAVVLPAVKVAWAMKNASFLRDYDAISKLTVRAEYGMAANSRFSSKLGRYYYQTSAYRSLAGTMRVGLPNSKLGPEKVITTNIGLDFALLGDRLNISGDIYEERTKDMLLAKNMAAAYGEGIMYDNAGEMSTRGVEVSFNAEVLRQGDFSWMLGGNIAHYENVLKKLGNQKERLYEVAGGATLIAREGSSPYAFYGHEAEHIFTTQYEADQTGYMSHAGTLFNAGDVKFKDVNGDHIIDDADRMVLGSPDPDFFGGFFSNMRYKGWNLFVNFTYTYGNEIYNAVRWKGESMSGFTNQFATAKKRWTYDGQGTDMPRAAYGDPMGNSRFSSRWIEDGSYLKLKEVTLSFEWKHRLWFFNRLKVYAMGENLVTWTKYVGMDPEFAYSYDPMLTGIDLGKSPLSRNIKVGLVVNF